MNKKEEVSKQKEVSKSLEKKGTEWKKWLLIGGGVLILIGGNRYLSMKKQVDNKGRVFEAQREVMMDYWREQGLSDEEIEEKMMEQKPMTGERPEGVERSSGSPLLRVVSGSGRLH